MKSLLDIVARVESAPASPWALATLFRTHGSTYRKPGTRLLVAPDGSTTGVLSGGCIEEEIGRIGIGVIAGGGPIFVSYDTRKLFGCDGRLDILVERIPAAGARGNLITAIGEALRERRPCRVLTRHEGGELGSTLLAHDAPVVETDGVFIHTVPLPVRMVVAGRGPEMEGLVRIAREMGWSIVCFTIPTDIPDDFRPDGQTAAVVMNHHFGRDLAALDRLLPMRLPYVGLLGPRKRQAELIARLQEYRDDFDSGLLESLHAPAGLDIGSEAPEEIALSITAEISAVLSGRAGGSLRDRKGAIHAVRKDEAA